MPTASRTTTAGAMKKNAPVEYVFLIFSALIRELSIPLICGDAVAAGRARPRFRRAATSGSNSALQLLRQGLLAVVVPGFLKYVLDAFINFFGSLFHRRLAIHHLGAPFGDNFG